ILANDCVDTGPPVVLAGYGMDTPQQIGIGATEHGAFASLAVQLQQIDLVEAVLAENFVEGDRRDWLRGSLVTRSAEGGGQKFVIDRADQGAASPPRSRFGQCLEDGQAHRAGTRAFAEIVEKQVLR